MPNKYSPGEARCRENEMTGSLKATKNHIEGDRSKHLPPSLFAHLYVLVWLSHGRGDCITLCRKGVK